MQTTAIYPGSFDPLTLGHIDVIERASRLFDQLIVAVGVNSAKKPLLSAKERMVVIEQACVHVPNLVVGQFSGLLMDYAREKEVKVIIRGLRATADFEYEFQSATVNRKLSDGLETLFLMTKWEHSFISSTVVKELAKLGGDFRTLVPSAAIPYIEKALKEKENSPRGPGVSK